MNLAKYIDHTILKPEATTEEVKAFETKQAIENGANEVDTVINVGGFERKEL